MRDPLTGGGGAYDPSRLDWMSLSIQFDDDDYPIFADVAWGEDYIPAPVIPPVITEPQFIGDGYKGHERASAERLKNRLDLEEIIARAYERVTNGDPATAPEKQVIAKQVFTAIETQGFDITLREIERLVRAYERIAAENDDMMVMLLA